MLLHLRANTMFSNLLLVSRRKLIGQLLTTAEMCGIWYCKIIADITAKQGSDIILRTMTWQQETKLLQCSQVCHLN